MTRLLKGQLRERRLASTYLFTGPAGIGKRLLAAEFAKALECGALEMGEPCDRCESCERIPADTYPDFKRVDPKSEVGQIGIDQIRELSHWIARTPSYGSFRIALVDGADQMTEEAAHACLKLLEEPPQRSVLLLIAPAPHRLPATFISRCHVVRCIPQGVERVVSFLQEKEGLKPPVSRMLGGLSGGRLGVAVEFHRKDLLKVKNAALRELLAAFGQRSVEVPLSGSSRPELEQALDWLAGWWRDLLVLELKGDSRWILHQDRLEEIKGGLTIDELLERIEWTYRAREAIQQNVSPRIALAALLCSP